MGFIQLVAFDTSKGGNTPNLCLANVCKGYGITNKYGSAWEAWQHTQQHTDPIPDGLDVPLYYSYTTTIDGITENYGHINVHLADGTVWSDGKIYGSIDSYLASHSPKFVGWGESVNDVKIIQGEEMLSKAQVDSMYVELLNRHATDAEQTHGTTIPFWDLWVALQVPNAERQNIKNMTDLGIQANKAGWQPGQPPAGVVPYSGAPLFVKKGK